jgi:potassium-dependent mechanosensitive channel
VLAFVLTLWISFFLARIIRVLLQDEILSRMNLKRGVPAAISMLVRIGIIGFGFLLAFGAAGIQLSNIAIIFGALSVGIGFGLQNIFNNLISGIIMAFERPIQVGDVVQVTGLNLMGEVREIGLRSSHIQTFEGAVVVVPNGNLISNEMINWTLTDRKRRYEINVGVKYGTDLKQVLEILNTTVAQHEAVLVEPPPLIVFDGFGESSLNFRVLFWLTIDSGLRARSEIGIAINEALKKAEIEIPFPQRDLHLRALQLPPETAKKKLSPTAPAGKKS